MLLVLSRWQSLITGTMAKSTPSVPSTTAKPPLTCQTLRAGDITRNLSGRSLLRSAAHLNTARRELCTLISMPGSLFATTALRVCVSSVSQNLFFANFKSGNMNDGYGKNVLKPLGKSTVAV